MVEQLKTKLEFEVGYSDRTRGGFVVSTSVKNKVTEIIVPALNNDVTRFEQGRLYGISME
jgi:hypothetical protein